MNINEMFVSLQGEGKYIGYPALFIRLSGCNKNCSFCDTKYHNEINLKLNTTEIVDRIVKYNKPIIVWTGGEPMLQKEEIQKVISRLAIQSYNVVHHLETNGTILDIDFFDRFDYIAFSPKDKEDAESLHYFLISNGLDFDYDIKIVTDLYDVGTDMLKYATLIMPLTIYEPYSDLKTQQSVWAYCVQNNKRYCPRIHVDVWKTKRGV